MKETLLPWVHTQKYTCSWIIITCSIIVITCLPPCLYLLKVSVNTQGLVSCERGMRPLLRRGDIQAGYWIQHMKQNNNDCLTIQKLTHAHAEQYVMLTKEASHRSLHVVLFLCFCWLLFCNNYNPSSTPNDYYPW